ncbi:MAG TPA: hypothetical protein PKC43_06110 [Phycisphaerales bacterium]|nr:hypothetical protein [Phycisphaerales bacterium]
MLAATMALAISAVGAGAVLAGAMASDRSLIARVLDGGRARAAVHAIVAAVGAYRDVATRCPGRTPLESAGAAPHRGGAARAARRAASRSSLPRLALLDLPPPLR